MALAIEVLTLFPRLIAGFAAESVLGKAIASGKVSLTTTDIRDFADDAHRTTDDVPYGGGAGMVLKAEPVARAIEAARGRYERSRVILLSPRGRTFTHGIARSFTRETALVLVAARYEGIDDRIASMLDDEVSIGDFILAGGEAAALCIIEAVTRLCPGVVGNSASLASESFESGLLEYPQFTRPETWRGKRVPEVLLSGNHAKIAAWRRGEALRITRERRPDLSIAVDEAQSPPHR